MACDSDLLVSLIEKRSLIFDFNHKDYSNRVVQDKLWAELVWKYIKLLCKLFYILYYVIYHRQICKLKKLLP